MNSGTASHKQLHYNTIPKKVSVKDFNLYIKPYLKKPKKGPKPKLSLYKIFNYILFVLHTGIQWQELKTNRNELYWTNVYKWHNRWSKDGSYQALFTASVVNLLERDELDTDLLHGDGSNMVVKKGAMASVTLDTNTRKAKKSLSLLTTMVLSSLHFRFGL